MTITANVALKALAFQLHCALEVSQLALVVKNHLPMQETQETWL